MKLFLREPPELLSTERETIENVLVLETSLKSLLIKRSRSIRFVPLIIHHHGDLSSSNELNEFGDLAYSIMGSEIHAGKFREFQLKHTDVVVSRNQHPSLSIPEKKNVSTSNHKDSCSLILSTPPTTSMIFIMKGKSDKSNLWTIGQFDWTKIDQQPNNNGKKNSHQSEVESYHKRRHSDNGRSSSFDNVDESVVPNQYSLSVYRLKRVYQVSESEFLEQVLVVMDYFLCTQLDKDGSASSICSIPSTVSENQSTTGFFAATIVHSNSLSVHIISVSSFCLVSSLTIPSLPLSLVPCVSLQWNILVVQKSTKSNFLVVWTQIQGSGQMVFGVISYSEDFTSVMFNGWQTLSFVSDYCETNNMKDSNKVTEPESDSNPYVVDIISIPLSSLAFRYNCHPNVLIIWSNGIYQLLSITTSTHSYIRTYSVSNIQEFWILPVSSSLVIEARWDSTKDVLWTQLRHLSSGHLFSLTPDGSSSQLELNTSIGIDLPSCPNHIQVIRTGRHSVAMLMRYNKQIYWRHFDHLEVATTASLLVSSCKTTSPSYCSSPLATLFGLDDHWKEIIGYINDQKRPPSGLIKDVSLFESKMNELISMNLVKVTVPLIDFFLELNLENCCRKCLHIPLIAEEVVVHLLCQRPTVFLVDIVRGVPASRMRLVALLRKEINPLSIQLILEQLSDWCSIQTTLPEVLLSKEFSDENERIPTLAAISGILEFNLSTLFNSSCQISEFLSILVDAKFTDLTTTENTSIIKSIQEIAASIATYLGAKRNYQKVHGQLFSVLETRKSDIKLGHVKPPIESAEIFI